jgi:hypothetical protein
MLSRSHASILSSASSSALLAWTRPAWRVPLASRLASTSSRCLPRSQRARPWLRRPRPASLMGCERPSELQLEGGPADAALGVVAVVSAEGEVQVQVVHPARVETLQARWIWWRGPGRGERARQQLANLPILKPCRRAQHHPHPHPQLDRESAGLLKPSRQLQMLMSQRLSQMKRCFAQGSAWEKLFVARLKTGNSRLAFCGLDCRLHGRLSCGSWHRLGHWLASSLQMDVFEISIVYNSSSAG